LSCPFLHETQNNGSCCRVLLPIDATIQPLFNFSNLQTQNSKEDMDCLYKNPNEPIEARIKNLLSRMTLNEKIGQMIQIERTVATPSVIKHLSIGSNPISKFDLKLKTLIISLCNLCLKMKLI